jgi:hypothetical protein
MSVNPEIVVIVTPDVTTVVPSVGALYPATVPQDDVVPSVVRYLPDCPD